jgi:hypothetical protein
LRRIDASLARRLAIPDHDGRPPGARRLADHFELRAGAEPDRLEQLVHQLL